jgi:hypothetical protein
LKTALKAAPWVAGFLALHIAFTGAAVGAAWESPIKTLCHSYANSRVAQQSGINIAITQIQGAPNTVKQGQAVEISVTVENQGEGPETFDFILREDTGGRAIGFITLTLEGNQTLALGFQWDTTLAPPQDYYPTVLATAPGQRDTLYSSLTLPTPITVEPVGVVFDSLEPPQATFGQGLARPQVGTPPEPLQQVFLGDRHISRAGALTRAAVTTPGAPANSIFVANAGATFQPVSPMQNPFLQGVLRGTLRLQGRSSSLGARAQVGGHNWFVDPDGGYRITALSGVYDVLLDSPGYVPVRILNAPVGSGEVLTLPEVTLLFGDANGDGKVDILDLSIAAGNFGKILVELEAP